MSHSRYQKYLHSVQVQCCNKDSHRHVADTQCVQISPSKLTIASYGWRQLSPSNVYKHISVETAPSPQRFRSSSETIISIREHKSISEHRIFPSWTDRFNYFRLEVRNMLKEEICALLGYHVAYRLLTNVLGQPIESADTRRTLTYWISWPLSIRTIGCPLPSVRNYPYTLRNHPEKRKLIYFASEAWKHVNLINYLFIYLQLI